MNFLSTDSILQPDIIFWLDKTIIHKFRTSRIWLVFCEINVTGWLTRNPNPNTNRNPSGQKQDLCVNDWTPDLIKTRTDGYRPRNDSDNRYTGFRGIMAIAWSCGSLIKIIRQAVRNLCCRASPMVVKSNLSISHVTRAVGEQLALNAKQMEWKPSWQQQPISG